jgi:hypothetical protein
MEDVVFWYILWPFGTLFGRLVCVLPFWYVVPKKSGNPDVEEDEN